MSALNSRYLCTSYSTNEFISLRVMLEANLAREKVQVFQQSYKRYRMSAQRFSRKPLNVEFMLMTDTGRRTTRAYGFLRR
jgi:adenine-specific DNA-methyltransferase